MLNTNYESLRPEIMDILRLFSCEEENFTHYFSYGAGEFYNCIEYDGNFFDFTNEFAPKDDLEFKRYAKRFAKLAFYQLLSKQKNLFLPWGALTGIRPTKMAYMEGDEGRNFADLFTKLGVSAENISLVEQVLQTQKAIVSNNKCSGVDLFISLPFCPTKCEYCSFITAPIASTKQYVGAYIESLVKEIQSVKPLLSKVNSVYIGGGTPFTIEARDLERVLQAVQNLQIGEVEFTVEAGRPDTFTEEKLALCSRYGVNRLCVNPQTFLDKTLVAIGRKHTTEQTLLAYEMAKRYGFSINIDLIAGLSGETAKDFAYSLNQAIALQADNITVHTLSLKAGAKLKENTQKLQIDGIAQMIALSREELQKAGYSPYYLYRQKYQAGANENVGWCKTGKACVYNVDVMEEICSNVAVGANAISKCVFEEGGRIERLGSPKDIPTYLAKTDVIIQERLALFQDQKL